MEEQLDLLEKLIPDCICSKLVPSGDILYKWVFMSCFSIAETLCALLQGHSNNSDRLVENLVNLRQCEIRIPRGEF